MVDCRARGGLMGKGCISADYKKMAKTRKFKPADIAAAVVKHRGDMASAADEVGCAVRTIYNYKDEYPEVADAIDESRKRTHSYVRGKLLELIDAGNVAAIIFYLKTQGKDEGWVERTEVTGVDGGNLKLSVEYVNDWRAASDQ